MRLPEVRALALDQRDARPRALAQRIAEPGDELEPAGAAADDDDFVKRGLLPACMPQRAAGSAHVPASRAQRHPGPSRRASIGT